MSDDFNGVYNTINWTNQEKDDFLRGFLGWAYKFKKKKNKASSYKYKKPAPGEDMRKTTIYIGYTPVEVVEDSAGRLYGAVVNGEIVDFNEFMDRVAKKAGLDSLAVDDLFYIGRKLIPYNPDMAQRVAKNAWPDKLDAASRFDQVYKEMKYGTNY